MWKMKASEKYGNLNGELFDLSKFIGEVNV
jgi:hypothetical protein